jgi:hypothetical protein
MQRHRNAAAAANREKEAKERVIQDHLAKLSHLESQLREVRYKAQQEEEGHRRVRTLLTQAKELLSSAGIPFLGGDATAAKRDHPPGTCVPPAPRWSGWVALIVVPSANQVNIAGFNATVGGGAAYFVGHIVPAWHCLCPTRSN